MQHSSARRSSRARRDAFSESKFSRPADADAPVVGSRSFYGGVEGAQVDFASVHGDVGSKPRPLCAHAGVMRPHLRAKTPGRRAMSVGWRATSPLAVRHRQRPSKDRKKIDRGLDGPRRIRARTVETVERP